MVEPLAASSRDATSASIVSLKTTDRGRHVQRPRARSAFGSATAASAAKLFSQRTNSLLGVQIVGVGSYVPDAVVTNEDLERERGFDPGWIKQRTGILSRRYAPPEMATSDMCVHAAQRAIRAAGIDPGEIDLVIVGTFTPDHQCPSTACLVQDRLGLDAAAFDLQAACSGFVYSLVTASQFVATGNSATALVIGADCNSRIVNPRDKKIAPLFGDGAGAVVVKKGDPHQGLVCYQVGADGSGGPLLNCPAGGTRKPLSPNDIEAGLHLLHMDGRNVFKWAVRMLADTIELVLQRAGMRPGDVSLYLLHQANVRIIEAAMQQLGIDPDRVLINLNKYGNTSAASIPIAMDEAIQQGRLQRGDTVLMSGFGAGLTWGTALFRW